MQCFLLLLMLILGANAVACAADVDPCAEEVSFSIRLIFEHPATTWGSKNVGVSESGSVDQLM